MTGSLIQHPRAWRQKGRNEQQFEFSGVGCQKAGQHQGLFAHLYRQCWIHKNTWGSVSQSEAGQGTILGLVLKNGIRNHSWRGQLWLFSGQLPFGVPRALESPEWPHTSKSSSHWGTASAEHLSSSFSQQSVKNENIWLVQLAECSVCSAHYFESAAF